MDGIHLSWYFNDTMYVVDSSFYKVFIIQSLVASTSISIVLVELQK